MTYLFSCGNDQFKAIKDGELCFDIDNVPIKVGDRVIYQEIDPHDKPTGQEHEVVVSFVLNADGLKNKFTAFQFKEKE